MIIIKYRAIFFAIAGIALVLSVFALATKGLNIGIDFTGGSVTEVSYGERPDIDALTLALTQAGFENPRIQMAGEDSVIIKTRALSEEERQGLTGALGTVGEEMTEKRFSSVGPSIGKELRTKAWIAIVLVIIGIVLFLAFAFRHVSYPLSSWKYGSVTAITMFHDLLIPVGIFAMLGKEVNTLFLVALLSVMGLSVHDTIVVFDRIRENLKNKISTDFATVVGKSLEQTFMRSINTSLTTMFVLATIFFFGPESTKDFSLLLWIGIFFGTYSSIFVATPLLVEVEKRQKKA